MVSKDFDLTKLNTFPKLLDYLRVELHWPIEDQNLDDLTFEYAPEELGVTEEHQININTIQQLRPLSNNQPWGIFFINFESKKLPIVLLRRLLSALVPKNRASSQSSSQPTWNLDDLLFVSLLGEEKNRQVCFSHFKETEKGLPVLQTFSWDETETHLYYLKKFNLGSLRWPSNVNNSDEWKSNWSSAFTASHGQVIKNSKELSVELAKIAKSIRHTVNEIYKYESDNGHYHKLLKMFREALIHDLESGDFSDMVAQTVTYGLFSAATTGEELKGLNNLSDLIPNTNPFLKSLFDELTTISTRKQNVNFDELGLNELFDILNETNMDAIMQQFGRQTGGGSEDPVIHFYEDFLEEYDKQEKVEKGVFYTPRPVVSFIVKSVHTMIINEYGLEDGLADISTWVEAVKKNPGLKKPPHAKLNDPFIQILDPAVGTGTFLVEVIDLIYQTMISKWEKGGKSKDEINNEWDDYVNNHLIPRIYGFELMMAPYSICHVKLGLKLKETGFDINNAKHRFNIFLTNTLEEPQDLEVSLFKPFLAIESEQANRIKLNFPITVIIGNPPYSGHSSNKGKWIEKLIEPYKKEPTGGKLKEKNPKWLNDDYVKFIRYSQRIIDKSNEGILAFITNNGYLDNPTFRGMRYNILQSFSQIHSIDLHGSSKKKEKAPDGSPDKNVFDIQQGVSIIIALKKRKKQNECQLNSQNLFGSRSKKNKSLSLGLINKIRFLKYIPSAPDYLFKYRDEKLLKKYNLGVPVLNIFKKNVMGYQTHRDHFAIGWNEDEIRDRANSFLNINKTDDEIYKEFSIKDNSDWELNKARTLIQKDPKWDSKIAQTTYRPFDVRYCYLSNVMMDRPRTELINNALNKENVLFGVGRQGIAVGDIDWCLTLVSKFPVDANVFRRGGVNLCPLYLYPITKETKSFIGDLERVPNINNGFLNQIESFSGLVFKPEKDEGNDKFFPINIIDYIYAILHSPTYKTKYKDFLNIDFPRVPFTKDQNVFFKMVNFGKNLRKIHLLESQKVDQFITTYSQDGDNTVVKPEYNEGRVSINKDQHFDGVPKIAWDFYIGGHQPAQKWLKDRKGRKLSAEDIEHYQKIIVALTETDRIMKEIDKVYPEVEKDLIEFKLDDLENKDKKKTEPDKNQKIFDLIKKGEGSTIEFKATLQKSIDNPNIPPTVIENNVIKSIAGFCNTEGGNLLIGVNDNGEIIGIEQDNFQSNDKFKNHLKNILDARVTKSVFSSIKTEFFNIEDKTVCCIECNKSDEPLYVNYEGDIHFYKRNLESTDSLNPQETMEYCKKRFK